MANEIRDVDITDMNAAITAIDGAGLAAAGYYNFTSAGNTDYWRISSRLWYLGTGGSEKFMVVENDNQSQLQQLNASLQGGINDANTTIREAIEVALVEFFSTPATMLDIPLAGSAGALEARTVVSYRDSFNF